jgi:hypothetical protein
LFVHGKVEELFLMTQDEKIEEFPNFEFLKSADSATNIWNKVFNLE